MKTADMFKDIMEQYRKKIPLSQRKQPVKLPPDKIHSSGATPDMYTIKHEQKGKEEDGK